MLSAPPHTEHGGGDCETDRERQERENGGKEGWREGGRGEPERQAGKERLRNNPSAAVSGSRSSRRGRRLRNLISERINAFFSPSKSRRRGNSLLFCVLIETQGSK